jgi:thiol-disulfide isomerase/thioredoxin
VAAIGDTTSTGKILAQQADAYALVGKPAPQLRADRWINAAKGDRTVDFTGKVTMLDFTATWCGACRIAYPALRTLHEQYQPKGLQVMFVGLIEGSVPGVRKMETATEAEELAYDREVWVEEDSISFPIALLPVVIPPDYKGRRSELKSPPLLDQYAVASYPAYYFIDKKGIVRFVAGYCNDPGLRFAAVIEKLLATN